MFEDAWIAEIDRITLEDQEPRRKLRMLEQYWIEQFADMCVNKQHAFQILTENEQKSIWKKRNRKLVNKRQRERRAKLQKVDCPCGVNYLPYNKSRHLKSWFHQNYEKS